MTKYGLELGEYVTSLICKCCNQPMKRVWGFASKEGRVHAVYYALLVEHGGENWAGLSVSVGNWWEDDAAAVTSRRWCHIWACTVENRFSLKVGEPEESTFHPWEQGGTALRREEMLASELRDEFFAVADLVNMEDPAVNSFLLGEELNIRGRGCKHEDGSVHYGGAMPS